MCQIKIKSSVVDFCAADKSPVIFFFILAEDCFVEKSSPQKPIHIHEALLISINKHQSTEQQGVYIVLYYFFSCVFV